MSARSHHDVDPDRIPDVATYALSVLEVLAAGLSPDLGETPGEYVQRHLDYMVKLGHITERDAS
jgi:hypothetical protein